MPQHQQHGIYTHLTGNKLLFRCMHPGHHKIMASSLFIFCTAAAAAAAIMTITIMIL